MANVSNKQAVVSAAAAAAVAGVLRFHRLALVVGLSICLVCSACWSGALAAGEQAAPPVEDVNPAIENTLASVLRDTPFNTVHGFIDACAKGNFDDAIQYFDLSGYKAQGMSAFTQREAAVKDAKSLYDLYLASIAPPAKEPGKEAPAWRFPCLLDPKLPLSNTPGGAFPEKRPTRDQEVPDNFDIVGVVDILGGHNEIWLERVSDSHTKQVLWLFTAKSIGSISLWKAVKIDGVALPDLIEINPGLPELPAADLKRLRRSTPKTTLDGFQAAAAEGNWLLAEHYMDLGPAHVAEAETLARRLRMIFERIGLPQVSGINDTFFGNNAAPEVVYDLSTLDTKMVNPPIKGQIQLEIRRDAQDKNGKTVWLISRSSVDQISDWYGRLGYGWMGDHLPHFFFDWQFLDLQLWQWLGVVVVLLLAIFLQFVIAGVVFWLFSRWASRTQTDWDDKVLDASRTPIRVFVSALLVMMMLGALALNKDVFELFDRICRSVEVISFVWLGYRLVDVGALAIVRMADPKNQTLDNTLLPLVRRIMKVTVVVVGGLFILQNLEVNVTGLIAALGVGGIAIALAGQKTVENLLGSITIAIDRPFKIGHFCKIGDYLGVIEDIGLRSTRVRTLDRTLVTIPNGVLSDMTIENFSHRDRIRWTTTIGVTYSASVEQIQYVVDEVKKLIYAHPKTFNDGIIVRFAAFGTSSQNIDVVCFVTTTDFMEFTAVREELCFEFSRIVAASGAGWAFPSQTLYLGKDGGVDSELQQRIAAEIKRRSSAGQLTIPEPSPALRDALIAQSQAGAAKSTPMPDPAKEEGEKPAAHNPMTAQPGADTKQPGHHAPGDAQPHTGEKIMTSATVDKNLHHPGGSTGPGSHS